MDWSEIERLLSSIYASRTGRPSYPILTLFRGLLLSVWSGLSDVQLSQCLYRDLLFRRFCRLELGGDVPDATTLRRFRTRLVKHDLWELLLGEVNRQLEEQRIVMTEGRIDTVDATPVEAARSGPRKGEDGVATRDAEAGLHVKKDSRGRMKNTCGYSVHTGVDEDGFVHRQTVTRATSTTARNATGCYWATRRRSMRTPPVVRARRGTNWRVSGLRTSCNARGIVAIR